MVETPEEGEEPDFGERIAANHQMKKDGWQRALHDMKAMAQDREDRGWETLTIPAGDTAPEPPDAGDTDRYGLVHVIPNNKADDFERLFDPEDFEETGVYQASSSGQVFLVTEHIDFDTETVIYIAGHYEMRNAPGLVRTAVEEGKMYTHVQLLDKTHLGTFEHDDVSAFFPDPEEFLAYEV